MATRRKATDAVDEEPVVVILASLRNFDARVSGATGLFRRQSESESDRFGLVETFPAQPQLPLPTTSTASVYLLETPCFQSQLGAIVQSISLYSLKDGLFLTSSNGTLL